MVGLKRLSVVLAFSFAAFCLAPTCPADSLDVTLTQSTITVSQGTTSVAFFATIFNPSATDTVYLNGDSPLTFSSSISVDDTPFIINAPISLAPMATSSSFEIFDVVLQPGILPGSYSGVFTILGGPDGGTNTDFSDLADVAFTVDVSPKSASTTPEPGTLLLLGSGLLAFAPFVRRKFARA